MSKKDKFIARGAFYLLIGVLLFYAASRTLDFVQNVMANSTWGYLFLFSTGLGALIWLYVYLSYAEGFKQRAIAFCMGILDLAGELVLVYADTIYVGNQKGLVKMSADEMNTFVIVSVLMVGINILAGYFFKLWDLEAEQSQHAQDLVDHVQSETMKHLNTPEAKSQMVQELLPIYRDAIKAQVQHEIYQRSSQHQGFDAKAVGWPMPAPTQPKELAIPAQNIPSAKGIQEIEETRQARIDMANNLNKDEALQPPAPLARMGAAIRSLYPSRASADPKNGASANANAENGSKPQSAMVKPQKTPPTASENSGVYYTKKKCSYCENEAEGLIQELLDAGWLWGVDINGKEIALCPSGTAEEKKHFLDTLHP